MSICVLSYRSFNIAATALYQRVQAPVVVDGRLAQYANMDGCWGGE